MSPAATSNEWSVMQLFNAPYDPVSAAYWSEPQQQPPQKEEPQPQPAKMPKLTTVEMKCMMCCEGCKKNVKRALSNMAGVRSIKVNTENRKVTVIGESLRPEDVLNAVWKASKKQTEMWPERRQADRKAARVE